MIWHVFRRTQFPEHHTQRRAEPIEGTGERFMSFGDAAATSLVTGQLDFPHRILRVYFD